MITIEKEGKNYNVKNDLNEITLKEFDRITEIYSDEKENNINKFIKVITELGLPYEVSNELGYKSLIKIIKELNLKGSELKYEFKLKDRDFKVEDLDELSAAKLAKIESVYREDKDMKTARIVAIVTGTDDIDFLNENLTVDIAGPILTKIDLDLLENIKL